MVHITRRMPLLIALSLLASAETSYAECAWVLWEERPLKSGEWRLAKTTASTFETKRSCDDTAAAANRSEASRVPASEPPRSSGASPTPSTRVGRRPSELRRRPPLAPVAPHQPRPARDAPHAVKRGGVVRGQGRVQEALALRSEIRRAGWFN
jgi:hypothetical protein